MPWDVVKRGDEWCVVKQGGETVACHDSEEGAKAQQRALYANEPEALALAVEDCPPGQHRMPDGRCMPDGEMSPDGYALKQDSDNPLGFEVTEDGAWEGTLILEGIEGGSAREFTHNSLTWDNPETGNMPFDWQYEYSHGGTNDKTTRVGTIRKMWREGPVTLPGVDQPVMLIKGEGTLDLGGPPDDFAHEAFRRMQAGTLTGVSGMVDKVKDADVEEVYPQQSSLEVGGVAIDAGIAQMAFGKPEKTIYHRGRVRGATLVEYPEFTEARVQLRGQVAAAPNTTKSTTAAYALGADHFSAVSDGPWNGPTHESRFAASLKFTTALRAFASVASAGDGTVSRNDCALLHHEVNEHGGVGPANVTAVTAALRALSLMRLPADRADAARTHLLRHLEAAGMSAPIEPTPALTAAAHVITIPDLPPAEWFREPTDVTQHGALTVTDQGRVYGWLAPANVAHRSFHDRSVYAPRNVDYTRFLGGETIVAGGGRVTCGTITMECGHANPGDPRRADFNWAPDHYHNTCSVVARVNVGESSGGTWVAGALVAGVTPEQITKMMACRLSGDWQSIRDQPGRRELVAALLVPVPGFPLARSAPSVRTENGELVAASVPVRVVQHDVDLPTVDAEREAFRTMVASLQRRIGRTPADRIAELRARVLTTAATDDIESFHGRHNQRDHGNWVDAVKGAAKSVGQWVGEGAGLEVMRQKLSTLRGKDVEIETPHGQRFRGKVIGPLKDKTKVGIQLRQSDGTITDLLARDIKHVNTNVGDVVASLRAQVHGTASLDTITAHGQHNQKDHGNWAERTMARVGDALFQQPKEDFDYPYSGEQPAPGRYGNDPFPDAQEHKKLLSEVGDRFKLSARQKLRLRQSMWDRDITRAAQQGEWDYVKTLLKKSGVARDI